MKIILFGVLGIAVLLFLADKFMQWCIRVHDERELEEHKQQGWFFKD